MRGENHFCPQMSGDFRLMTMGKHAIRLQAHLTKLLEIAALRPAPLTPLVALITGHWLRSSSPASINGFSESCAAVR